MSGRDCQFDRGPIWRMLNPADAGPAVLTSSLELAWGLGAS
jgi:hypothetical protein